MSTAYAKTLNHMFIFLSYKKFIAGAGLLVRHQARNHYCIPQEDRGLCVSPGGGGKGWKKAVQPPWKAHRAWDRTRELQTRGVEGARGERMGEDGAWTRVQRADTVRLQKVCFLPVSSSCPGSFGVTESAEHGAKPWQKPRF